MESDIEIIKTIRRVAEFGNPEIIYAVMYQQITNPQDLSKKTVAQINPCILTPAYWEGETRPNPPLYVIVELGKISKKSHGDTPSYRAFPVADNLFPLPPNMLMPLSKESRQIPAVVAWEKKGGGENNYRAPTFFVATVQEAQNISIAEQNSTQKVPVRSVVQLVWDLCSLQFPFDGTQTSVFATNTHSNQPTSYMEVLKGRLAAIKANTDPDMLLIGNAIQTNRSTLSRNSEPISSNQTHRSPRNSKVSNGSGSTGSLVVGSGYPRTSRGKSSLRY